MEEGPERKRRTEGVPGDQIKIHGRHWMLDRKVRRWDLTEEEESDRGYGLQGDVSLQEGLEVEADAEAEWISSPPWPSKSSSINLRAALTQP